MRSALLFFLFGLGMVTIGLHMAGVSFTMLWALGTILGGIGLMAFSVLELWEEYEKELKKEEPKS